jgi:hypothetical protein
MRACLSAHILRAAARRRKAQCKAGRQLPMVERLNAATYAHAMDKPPDTDARAELVAGLLASKAESDRGERVPMQPVLDRMQGAIDRIRAGRPKTGLV